MGSFFEGLITETDQICEIHGSKKQILKNNKEMEPVCVECATEKKEQQEKEFIVEMTKKSEKAKTQSWLKNRSIILDQTLKNATFENYDTADAETKKNKEHALNIAREYYKGATYNTVLRGKPGTGKSHLAMSILKIVNEHSEPYRRCIFVSVDEMMRLIRGSFNNRDSQYTEERVVDTLTKADLLVLDDLGAETGAIGTDKAASNFTSRVLYAIINGRMNKPTIMTTNLNGPELTNMYDSKLLSRMYRGAKGHTIVFEHTNDKRLESLI